MVSFVMWQCQNCQYQNDEWDQTCVRCTTPRGASSVLGEPAEAAAADASAQPMAQTVPGTELTAAASAASESPAVDDHAISDSDQTSSFAQVVSSEQPASADLDRTVAASAAELTSTPPSVAQAAPVDAGTAAASTPPPVSSAPPLVDARPPRPASKFDAALTTLIIVLVFGLVVVAWLAVQRGALGQWMGQAQDAAETQQLAPDGSLLPADPLDMLNDKGVGGLKPLRQYAKVLREVDVALEGHSITGGAQPGTLSDESAAWIESLMPMADSLVQQYEQFETAATKDASAELEPYKAMLREQFAARMQTLLEPVAEARSKDVSGNLKAYLISDTFTGVLDRHGKVDSAPLKDRWLEALHAKDQLALDISNTEVYKQLEARLAVLTELHNDYSQAFRDAPQYKVRNGYIDVTAGKLLELYNELGQKIEDFVTEFEEYSAGLDPAKDSDRRKELIKQFLKLAQEDHEYAFEETYKMYEKDKELSHPAYKELAARVEFVKQHWPDLESRYRVIYTQHELAWDRRWKDEPGTNGSAPPTDWSGSEQPLPEPPAGEAPAPEPPPIGGGGGEGQGGGEGTTGRQ